MRDLLSGSLVYRGLSAAARWLDGQWARSLLARLLTTSPTAADEGLVSRAGHGCRSLLCRLFRALRLERVLAGSILTRSYLWCMLCLLLAPLIPTMAVLGLACLSLISVLLSLGLDPARRAAVSPVNRWVLLYAFVYLVCSFTSVTPAASLNVGLLSAVFILFAVVLQNGVTTRAQLEGVIWGLVAVGTVVSLVGFYQVLTGVESTAAWVDASNFSSLKLRVYATLDNPNVLSEYLLLILPLAASCAITARNFNGRLAAALAFCAMLLCLLLTYSRGGWVAFAVSAALFLVLLDRRFLALGLLCIPAVLLVLPPSILQRLGSITDLSDSSTSYRIYIWMATLNMLKDYWFCGIGTGVTAYNAVYPRYSFNAVSAPHAHNLYLQVASECGICGIVTLLGVVLSTVRALGAAIRRKTGADRVRLIAVLSGLTGFCVQSFTDHSFYNYRVMLIFWAVIGLGALLCQDRREDA